MTYLNFAKWDVYSLLKRKYVNIELFKKIPTKFIWLIIGAIYLTEMITMMLTVTYISDNTINTGIDYVDFLINKILKNDTAFFGVMVAISLILATTLAISSKKYMKNNKRYNMIISLANMEKEKTMNIMLLDFILVSQSETLMLVVFAVIGFAMARFNCVIAILLGILFVALVVETSYMVIVCNYMWQNNKIKICLSIIAFVITFKLGSVASKWIAEFPLMKKVSKEEEFLGWLDNGKVMLYDMFACEELIKQINGRTLAIVMLVFTAIILLVRKRIVHFVEDNNTKAINIRVSKKKNYYEKIAIRKNMSAFNFLIQPIWWSKMGVLLGIAKNANNSKIEIIVGIFLAINMSFSFSKNMIDKNNKVLSLDGEGKKVIFWLENLKNLFNQKEKIWMKSIVVVTVFQYILFILMTNKIEYAIFLPLQFAYMLMTYYMFTIPSIIVPHYEVENESELLMCADRQKLYSMIEFAFVCGINIAMELPSILFITDYISLNNFYLMQFGIVILAIIMVSCVIRAVVIKQLKSEKYIRLIYK